MTPTEFAVSLKVPALSCEEKHGIPYLFTIAQASLESGWGKSAIGNNIFGIKAGSKWTGKKQLVTTTEYFKDDKQGGKFPLLISITKVSDTKYKYIVKDWFRDYDTLEDCLEDHATFLLTNKRYESCFSTSDPYEFATRVANAGYATAPDYGSTLHSMIDSVKRRLGVS